MEASRASGVRIKKAAAVAKTVDQEGHGRFESSSWPVCDSARWRAVKGGWKKVNMRSRLKIASGLCLQRKVRQVRKAWCFVTRVSSRCKLRLPCLALPGKYLST